MSTNSSLSLVSPMSSEVNFSSPIERPENPHSRDVNFTRPSCLGESCQLDMDGNVQTRVNIHSRYKDEYETPEIKVYDQLNGMKLYHFDSALSPEELKKNYFNGTLSEDIIRNRGVIRGENGKIVCKSFNYTHEILSSEKQLIKQTIHSFNQSRVYLAEEGSMVRLFFSNDRWYISTHRKIDAYNSRWGSVPINCFNENESLRSFGELFKESLICCANSNDSSESESEFSESFVKYIRRLNFKENHWNDSNSDELFDLFTDRLNRNKTYSFLIRNTVQNRVVCHTKTVPCVYFLGSFDNETNLLVEGNDSGIETPKQLFFENVDQLIEYVDNINPYINPGVVVYLPNQKQVKIISPKYDELAKIRGNEPNVMFRYLQLRSIHRASGKNLDDDLSIRLRWMYPERDYEFTNYEYKITKLIQQIYTAYKNRFIFHIQTIVPQPQYFIMQKCHSWHLSDKKNNRVTIEKVKEIVDSRSAFSMNKLFKTL